MVVYQQAVDGASNTAVRTMVKKTRHPDLTLTLTLVLTLTLTLIGGLSTSTSASKATMNPSPSMEGCYQSYTSVLISLMGTKP